MSATIKPAPVRKSVRVKATQARAFQVFAEKFSLWWPPSHSIGKSKQTLAVIEPRAGGRWYEIGEDGSECQWGQVLAFEPPSRLLLAWQINGAWQFDAGLSTEVEVLFMPDGEGFTRVELEHRHLERLGDKADTMRAAFDSPNGWGAILDLYAIACAG